MSSSHLNLLLSLKQLATILLLALCVPIVSLAQDSRDIANAKYEYSKAEEAYGKDDFKTCLEFLDKSQSYRGNNILIQYLRCKARFAMNDYKGCEIEIDKFYKMASSDAASDPRFLEIVEIERSIDELKNAEVNLYNKAVKANSLVLYNEYLEKYEQGKYVNKVNIHISALHEQKYFKIVKKEKSIASYEEYMNNVSSGKRLDSISAVYSSHEESLYKECVSDPNMDLLELYLSEFKLGKHRTEIGLLVREKREYTLYQKSISSNQLSVQKAYVISYPEGAYINEVNEVFGESLIKQARGEYQLKNFRASNQYCEDYLLYFPNGNGAEEIKGYLENGYYEEAKAAYYAKNYMTAFAIYYSYAQLFPDGKNVNIYITASQKKLNRTYANPPVDRLSIAEIYLREGKYKESMSHIKFSFLGNNAEYGRITSAFNTLSRTESSSEEDALMAKEIGYLSVKLNPDNTSIMEGYAEILYKNGQFTDALELYVKAFEQSQTESSCFKICQLYLRMGKYDELNAHGQKAIIAFPNNGMSYGYYGRSNFYLGNYEKSLKDFDYGISICKDQSAKKTKILLLNWKSYSHHALGQKSESDMCFLSIYGLDSKDPYSLGTRAYIMADRNEKISEALEMSKKAIELNPDMPAAYHAYAWSLYKNSKYSDALKQINKAIDMCKSDYRHITGSMLEHKGDILYKLQKKTEALSYWKNAKTAGGGSKNLEKKITNKKLYQ